RGDTNGAGSGLKFYLHDRELGAPPAPDATSDLVCETGADGQCEIDVPERVGDVNSGNPRGYWITAEIAGTSDWQRIGDLGLGNYSSPKTPTPYMFHTGNLPAGQTHDVTAQSTPREGGVHAGN